MFPIFLSIPVIGFEVPNHFLVGYALDYNEYFRDLKVSGTKHVVSGKVVNELPLTLHCATTPALFSMWPS